MRESERKLFKHYLEELRHETTNQVHTRILNAAIQTESDFLTAMENELGKYLMELLDAQN